MKKNGVSTTRILSIIFIVSIFLALSVYADPREDLLFLINKERVANGVEPLAANPNIEIAAQLHSEDMLAQNYFSHTSLDGRTFVQRMNNAGYFGTAYGENIAWHTGDPNPLTVFNGWKNSPGHYANMINPNYDSAGIGYVSGNWAYNGYYSSIWTLDLGKSICTNGETRQCGVTDEGACEYGIQTCSNSQWGSCSNAVYPIQEICDNNEDDDCDGELDETCLCFSHSYTSCYNNGVYWYDSCGQREDLLEDCGSDSYVSENYCYNNDVYRDYNDTTCINNACQFSITRIKQQECYSAGCVNNACAQCTSHFTTKCYLNDVYWYNSCDQREEKKEECGTYGCTNGNCNAPICGDYDGDNYIDSSCGGTDCNDNNAGVFPGALEVCNNIDDNCNTNIDDNCKESFIIVYPIENAEFNSSYVNVMLNVSSLSGYVRYSLDNKTWYSFCNQVGLCLKKISMKQGFNILYLKANDASRVEHRKSLRIFVDSRKPDISSQYPISGGYTNGIFSVKYTEDYLQKVELYIAPPDSNVFQLSQVINSCPSGRYQICNLNQELSQYNGKVIQYYFKIYDKFFFDKGVTQKVTVDTITPIITINSFEKTSTTYWRYSADIKVSEPVKLQYKHSNSANTYIICTSCSNRIKTFSFTQKPEWIDIIAIDKAGNQDIERINIP